jgi:ATP-binding cassette, subfamily C, bacterial CydD
LAFSSLTLFQVVTAEVSPQASRWLRAKSRVSRRWVWLNVVAGLIDGGLAIAQAAAVAAIVHGAFFEDRGVRELAAWLAVVGAAALLRALSSWVREELGASAGAALRASVRDELARRLLEVGPAGREQIGDGELATIVVEQIEALDDYVAKYLPQRVVAVVVPLAIVFVVLPQSWVGALILFLTAPVIPFFAWLIGLGAAEASQRQFAALGRLGTLFIDRLRGLATLKIFGRIDDEVARLHRSTEDYRRRTMGVLKIAFLSSAVLELFSAIGVAMMAVYLGFTLLGEWRFGLWSQELSFRVALFLLILAADFYLPLRALGGLHHAKAAALGASEKLCALQTLLEEWAGGEASARGDAATRRQAVERLETIRFENVTVSFGPGSRPALDGVSLEIEPGERVAIVGRNGAGKSTLLSLILGMIEPTDGRVCVGDRVLTELDPESWYRQIGWVGQQPTLFHGTLRSNIALGAPDASVSEIEAAAAAARVTEIARELPAGLDSKVGEDGVGLSGGQIQRVALARAYLRSAPLLVLDEPTANLDAHNEALVLEALEGVTRGRTVVLVTHRLRACRDVDRVVMLERGRVVRDGPPGEVLGELGRAGGERRG